MKIKIFLTFLLSIFFQKSFSEIITLTLLAGPNGQKILFLGDRHRNSNEETAFFQFDAIYNFLSKSKKTDYIYEIIQNDPLLKGKKLKKIENFVSQLAHSLDLDLLKKINLLDYFYQSNFNKVIFKRSDIRSSKSEKDEYDREQIANLDPSTYTPTDLKVYIDIFGDHLDYNFKNINNLKERTSKLLETNQKEFLNKKLEELEAQFYQLLTTLYKKSELTTAIRKQYKETFTDINCLVSLADIGFILSIFEGMQEKCGNIILHAGAEHTENIINFLVNNFNFSKLVNYPTGIGIYDYLNIGPIDGDQLTTLLKDIFETPITKTSSSLSSSSSSSSSLGSSSSVSSSQLSSSSSSFSSSGSSSSCSSTYTINPFTTLFSISSNFSSTTTEKESKESKS